MRWDPVAMDGVIHSMTWTRHPFSTSMVSITPFVSVLVALPQAGGARLLGTLAGAADDSAIGAQVEGVIASTDEGLPALRWKLTT